MAKHIDEELVYCENCEKTTVCMRNSKKINWLMQLVLVIFTAGIWFVVITIWGLWKGATSPIPGTGNKKLEWICSVCGKSPNKAIPVKTESTEEGNDKLVGYVVIALVVFIVVMLLS